MGRPGGAQRRRQAASEPKRLALPPQPPHVNCSQRPPACAQRGKCPAHGPASTGRLHWSTIWHTFVFFTLYPALNRIGRWNLVLNTGFPLPSPAFTLRSPFSAEFWKHCVLSGGTQHHAFASTAERRHKNNKYFISSKGILCSYSRTGLNSTFLFWWSYFIYYGHMVYTSFFSRSK